MTKRGAAPPPLSPKDLLKKIAEAGAVELELNRAAASAAFGPAPAPKGFPTWWRMEVGALFPVSAQVVVAFSLFRIAQDLVSLVDLFEFLLRLGLVLGHIRMVLPRQLPKCLADLVLARRPGHPERFVIILIFDTHNLVRAVAPAILRRPTRARW